MRTDIPEPTFDAGNSLRRSRGVQIVDWEWAIALGLSPTFLFPGWWSWIALAVLLGLWLLRWQVSGRIWRSTALDWPIVLVLAGAGAGLYAALDPALGGNRAWSLAGGILVYRALANSGKSEAIRRWAGPGLTLLAVLIGLGSLLVVDWEVGDLLKLPLIYDHLPHIFHSKFGSGAAGEQEINPRTVAGALVMLLPVALITALNQHGRRNRTLAWLALAFLSAVLLLTQAPTAFAGLLAAVALFGLGRWMWGRPWRMLVAGIAVLVALVGGITLALVIAQRLPAYPAEPTLRIGLRMEMWLRAGDMFSDMPFTGAGLNNFPRELLSFYPTYSTGPEPNAHNILLQTAVDGGIVALLGFVGVLGGVALTLWRGWQAHTEPPTRALLAAIGVGTFAWLVYGVGESITLAHKPALILWLLWGCAAVLAPPVSLPARRRVVTGAVSLGVLVVLLIAGWSMLSLNLAILNGQRAVQSGDTAQTTQAYDTLVTAIAGAPRVSAAVLDLEARLAEKRGDNPAASRALRAEVMLDAIDPTAKYIPGEWAIWHVAPAPQPEQRVYLQWKARFPSDPFAYARLAVLAQTQCDAITGQAVLQEGLNQTNAPFLHYLQDTLLYTRCGT